MGLGWAARTGAALVEYRVAYAYVLPAMIGMLVLVFFPFFYGIALSFTNANIYNTDKPIFETWVGLQNYIDILSDFHVVHRHGGRAGLELSEFLLHAGLHHRLDGLQRGDRRHRWGWSWR